MISVFWKFKLQTILKKKLLFALLFSTPLCIHAQKGNVKIDLKGGVSLPEKEKLDMNATGYLIGVNFKYYLNNRFYVLLKASGNRLTGDKSVGQLISSSSEDWPKEALLSKRITDTMLGVGMGWDILKKNRHSVYFQSAFGIGVQNYKSEVWKDNDNNRDNGYSIYHRSSDNYADWALSGDLGYIYSITDFIGIGASYSADYIAWGFSQGFNINLQFTF